MNKDLIEGPWTAVNSRNSQCVNVLWAFGPAVCAALSVDGVATLQFCVPTA